MIENIIDGIVALWLFLVFLPYFQISNANEQIKAKRS
jgi:hypothetical protein